MQPDCLDIVRMLLRKGVIVIFDGRTLGNLRGLSHEMRQELGDLTSIAIIQERAKSIRVNLVQGMD
jgi:hypothetical protein